jgi:hypothetical protein
MSSHPRIFLETSALKFASERILCGYRVSKVIRWGNADVTIPMARWYEDYPNHRLGWRQWRQILEISCLPSLAWMARQGRVELLSTNEVVLELRGLPKTGDPRGLFYGAPITWVKSPAYTVGTGLFDPRVTEGGTRRPLNARERELEFFARMKRRRFLDLQKATGAYQGTGKPPDPNQLWDAFHVWSAESAGADYFLTLDMRLLRHLRSHRRFPPSLPCLSPVALLRRLEKDGAYSWRDWPDPFRSAVRQVRSPRTTHPLEELVALTRVLDRAERPPWWRRWFGRQ